MDRNHTGIEVKSSKSKSNPDHTVIEIKNDQIVNVFRVVDPSDVLGDWFEGSHINPEAVEKNCVWVTVAALLNTTVPKLRERSRIDQNFKNGTNVDQFKTMLKALGQEFVAFNIEIDGKKADELEHSEGAEALGELPNRHGVWYRRADGSGHSIVRQVPNDGGDKESQREKVKYICYQGSINGKDKEEDVRASKICYIFYLVGKVGQEISLV
jgi:hypothetical protein